MSGRRCQGGLPGFPGRSGSAGPPGAAGSVLPVSAPEPEQQHDQPRWTAYVRLADVVPADRNPKKHAIPDLKASLAEFGFVELPTVDERTGKLVAGHGRLEATAELLADAEVAGLEPPEGVLVDDGGHWKIPVSRGWASRDDDHAGRYLMASNHLSAKGGWDERARLEYLEELQRAERGLIGTGFTTDDINAMLAEQARRNPEAPPEFKRVGADLETHYECPRCAYKWSGNAAPTATPGEPEDEERAAAIAEMRADLEPEPAPS